MVGEGDMVGADRKQSQIETNVQVCLYIHSRSFPHVR